MDDIGINSILNGRLGPGERFQTRDGLSFVVFDRLAATGMVKHGFSTRVGGTSRGCFESLNLSYFRGDVKEDVDENFRRAAAFFDAVPGQIVCGHQTHTDHIRRVDRKDAGKGVTRERDYTDVDGLITDEPGLLLMTSHADCTPLFFVDPIHRAIGLSHSGWKGTLAGIGIVTVRAMHEAYGTEPADIIAAVGPCACGHCYEVGPEVAEAFAAKYGEDRIGRPGDTDVFLFPRYNGKYLLDQKAANVYIMKLAGILPEHITVSGLCTMEEDRLFYSHRKMGERRGNLGAFLMLEEADCHANRRHFS